ncbi:hypothetical protein [Novosphingobium sp. AAP93]|uniref:hypothetical protein n=1 Tax=Novosphingobium sp. AAP93 TaxID=1523427 RepID=UPI000B008FA4|nr:hypothetical protein [Novosphingobium sp. AAP93]
MRLALLLPLMLVASCDSFKSEEVAKCESALQSGLKAPSTYKAIKISEFDSPNALKEIEDLYKTYKISLEFHDFRDKLPKVSAPFKSVYVEYDAENSFGTPIRSTDVCYFGTNNDPKFTTGKATLIKFVDTQFLQKLGQMK